MTDAHKSTRGLKRKNKKELNLALRNDVRSRRVRNDQDYKPGPKIYLAGLPFPFEAHATARLVLHIRCVYR